MSTSCEEVLKQLRIKIKELLQFYNLQVFHELKNAYEYTVFPQNHDHGYVGNFLV